MLKKIKLTAKLYGSFAMVLVLMLAVAWVGYRTMVNVVERADKKGNADTIERMFLEIRMSQRAYQLRHDEESLKSVNEGIVQIQEKVKKTSANLILQEDIEKLSEVANAVKGYHDSFLAYVELFRQREVLMEKIRTTGNLMLATVEEFASDVDPQIECTNRGGNFQILLMTKSGNAE